MDNLQQQLDAAKEQIADLTKSNAEKDALIESNATQLAEKDALIESNATQLAEKDALIENLQSEIESLSAKKDAPTTLETDKAFTKDGVVYDVLFANISLKVDGKITTKTRAEIVADESLQAALIAQKSSAIKQRG